ncbi:hypothetical protein [Nitrosopumilus adriaticus]|uniref:Uncharacterized protein n=1 Tax=Nitrosopumilus adriaticus TaxID=1580092 RepID=A0A0D5C3R7_9ARCH|nr:hypothetical protein [Nitrosopumilus adriaticus]AJW71047.1 hypothetical protein NADRNF5_1361 [Nitrosopumilus adriaticus]
MVQIGIKTETVKCTRCKKKIKAEVLSESLGTTSIKGTKINKTIKLEHHKKEGFFSRKCIKSGSSMIMHIWHPSDKVRKTRCHYCKRKVSAFIVRSNSRNNGFHIPVTKSTTITTMRLLYHKRERRKCHGSGKIVKEKSLDYIDNDHP